MLNGINLLKRANEIIIFVDFLIIFDESKQIKIKITFYKYSLPLIFVLALPTQLFFGLSERSMPYSAAYYYNVSLEACSLFSHKLHGLDFSSSVPRSRMKQIP